MKGRALTLLLALCAMLIAGLFIPLALGNIGPNGWYGIRAPASSESGAGWIEVNRTGGTLGAAVWLVYGLCLLWLMRRPPESVGGQIALIVSFVSVTVGWVILMLLFLRL